MSSLRPKRAAVALMASALIFALSACSHTGSSVMPHTGGTNSYASPVSVITHETHLVRSRMMSARQPAGSPFAANVTTLPVTIYNPGPATYDPDDGNVYVIDQSQASSGQAQILKVAPSGSATLFATLGSGTPGGIVYDHNTSTFYVSTGGGFGYPDAAVLAIDASATITLLAGGAASGTSDGTGSAAKFEYLSGITLDHADGALYVADGSRTRRVTTAGVVTTFTGPGSIGRSGDAPFEATALVWDAKDGNIYAVDTSADVIRKITPSKAVTVLAGVCVPNNVNSCSALYRDGSGKHAAFARPTSITVDPGDGSLYVSDWLNNDIRHITLSGVVSTFAGNGIQARADGAGLNALFDAPEAIVKGGGLLYVLETGTYCCSASLPAAMRSITLTGAAPPPLATPITLYDTPTAGAQPYALAWRTTTPASSKIWFTELTGRLASVDMTGAMTEYPLVANPPNSQVPTGIALGNSGTPWFLNLALGAIFHRTSTGTIDHFMLPSGSFDLPPQEPKQMVTAPNGNVWFFPGYGYGSQIGYIKPSGAITFVTPPSGYSAGSMAIASDGTLWMASGLGIMHMTAGGTEIKLYQYNQAQYITLASDGNVWFTQSYPSDDIGMLNVQTGLITLYPLYFPTPSYCQGCYRGVTSIAQGADGAIYVVEQYAGAIGRLDSSGSFSEYPVYAPFHKPFDINNGPDGNIWFTDQGSQKIGKLDLTKL